MVRRGMTGERLSALFLLGLVLLLPPLIGVFDKPVLVAGIPLLYLYLFVAWGGLILLTALAVERPTAEDDIVNDESGATATGGEGAADSSDSSGASGA